MKREDLKIFKKGTGWIPVLLMLSGFISPDVSADVKALSGAVSSRVCEACQSLGAPAANQVISKEATLSLNSFLNIWRSKEPLRFPSERARVSQDLRPLPQTLTSDFQAILNARPVFRAPQWNPAGYFEMLSVF